MKVVLSKTFIDGYSALPKEIQTRVDKTIRLLAGKTGADRFHPGLRAKRIQGTVDLWEASVTMKYRLTFQMYEDTLYLRVVGDHDPTLRRP